MPRCYLVSIRQLMDDVPVKIVRRKSQAVRLAARFDRDVATLAAEAIANKLRWNEPTLPISIGFIAFGPDGHAEQWTKVKELDT